MNEPTSKEDELARKVIGAYISVHRHLGPGYLESIYESALEVELQHLKVSYERQVPLPLQYRGKCIGEHRLDFLVKSSNAKIIVELKAVNELAPIHKAQVISYLRATNLNLGLLINFNTRLLKDGLQRVVLSSYFNS